MKWYYINFDPKWCTCRNPNCKETFILKSVNGKHNCPICKMNSKGELK